MKIRLADAVYRGFWNALDWIYPPVCAGCGAPGDRLCSVCDEKIALISGKICQVCGEPISSRGDVCEVCSKNRPSFTSLRSLAKYAGVTRECIHALKYENNQALGEFFSRRLEKIVLTEDWQIDLVLPVPLSRQRLAERGYNQAALVAKPLALRLGCVYNPFGLKRTRDTKSQVGLSGEERRRNVVGAFAALPEIVSGKAILVVDDVMTTGATMEACARALLDGGAETVYCLTIGRFNARNHLNNLERHLV